MTNPHAVMLLTASELATLYGIVTTAVTDLTFGQLRQPSPMGSVILADALSVRRRIIFLAASVGLTFDGDPEEFDPIIEGH